MEFVNKTKVMLQHYNSYVTSEKYSLDQAYGRYSDAKEKAWNYCVELCKKYDGRCLRVIGANTFKFSAGFLFDKDGVTYFVYITDCHDKAMPLD